MKKLFSKQNSGFLTVEILIAMTIITILLGAVVMASFGNQNFLVGGQTNSEAVVTA